MIAGFAVATWQFSIGPTLGLPFTYLLCALGAIAAVVWIRRGRPRWSAASFWRPPPAWPSTWPSRC